MPVLILALAEAMGVDDPNRLFVGAHPMKEDLKAGKLVRKLPWRPSADVLTADHCLQMIECMCQSPPDRARTMVPSRRPAAPGGLSSPHLLLGTQEELA